MTIGSNLAAQSASNDLTRTSAALTKSLAKLSSGSRIVNAFDDAGGLAISMRFDAKLERANAAKVNLIPFNPFPASGLVRSNLKQVQLFAQTLSEADSHWFSVVWRTRFSTSCMILFFERVESLSGATWT